MKYRWKKGHGYGIVLIETVMILFCAGMLMLAYRYDCIRQENQRSAMIDILKMNSDRVETLFSRLDMLVDMMSDPSNDYTEKLNYHSGNRVDDYNVYNQVKKRFESEVNIVFSDTVTKYVAVWLMDDSLKITDMFAYPRFNQDYQIFKPQNGHSSYFRKLSEYQNLEEINQCTMNYGTDYLTFDDYPNVVYMINHSRISVSDSTDNYRIHQYDLGLLILGIDFSAMFVDEEDPSASSLEYILLNDREEVMAANYNGEIGSIHLLSTKSAEQDGNIIYCKDVAEGLTLYTLCPSALNQWLYLKICACVSLILVCMGLLMATYISRLFLRPIAALSERIASHEQESIPDEMYKHYHRDLIRLVLRYNDHIRKIGCLIEDIQKQQQKEFDVEMKLLQTQINPHFIYNTFDVICYRELMRGEDDVAGILNDVSTIMRYGINEPDKLVSFQQEISMLEHYMSIEHICYDVPIEMSVDVDENCRNILVPKMILQPLAENALLHGRCASDQEIILKLSGRINDDVACIALEDSGSEADVEEINRRLNAPEGAVLERRKGIGTLNVHLRIQRRFGSDYGLHFKKNEDNRTVAEIRIPIRNEDHAEDPKQADRNVN